MHMPAIGDAVNAASRLETATRDLNCQLVVSEHLVELVGVTELSGLSHDLVVRGNREALKVRAVDNLTTIPDAQS